MIVTDHDSAERIQAGRQTAVLQLGERRWWPGGKPHPLQDGAYGEVYGVARVLSVRQVRFHQLTLEDAKALGFPSVVHLRDDWRLKRRRENRWHPNRQAHLIRFVYSGVPEEYKQTSLLDQL